MKIRLDRTVCDGFGLCAKHAPGYFSLDDWGYASLAGDDSVADNDRHSPKQETVAERVRRLQMEAKQLAKDHVRTLSAAILHAEQIAAEIAEGGDAYPPGIRDLARRFVEDAAARVQTLEAISGRQ